MEQTKVEAEDGFIEIEQLDPDTVEFTSIDGRQFRRTVDIDSLAVARYEAWERISIELGFALDFKSMFDSIGNAEQMVMDNNRVGAIIELNNLKRGMARITGDRHTIAMYLCTLFIVEKGEDPFTWNVETADSKIQCWSKQYAVGFFLTLAINTVNGFKERFLSITQEYSALSNLSQHMQAEAMDEPEISG